MGILCISHFNAAITTMTTTRITKAITTGIFLAIVLFALNSCSKKIAFNTSPVVPAARGYVKIKKDGNGNYHIGVSITGLAEVERLQGNKKTYVVWMTGDNNDSPKNIGQINSSSSMFSSKLKASFESVSSVKPTKVFVTAEEDGQATYPGNLVILTT